MRDASMRAKRKIRNGGGAKFRAGSIHLVRSQELVQGAFTDVLARLDAPKEYVAAVSTFICIIQ